MVGRRVVVVGAKTPLSRVSSGGEMWGLMRGNLHLVLCARKGCEGCWEGTPLSHVPCKGRM
jgi:hypothetical protein